MHPVDVYVSEVCIYNNCYICIIDTTGHDYVHTSRKAAEMDTKMCDILFSSCDVLDYFT